MHRYLTLILSVSLIMIIGLTSFVHSQQEPSEQIRLTTYYPTPYAVYRNPRLYPYPEIVAGGDCSDGFQRGEMAYSASEHRPLFCNGTNWTVMGAGNIISSSFDLNTTIVSNATSTNTNRGDFAMSTNTADNYITYSTVYCPSTHPKLVSCHGKKTVPEILNFGLDTDECRYGGTHMLNDTRKGYGCRAFLLDCAKGGNDRVTVYAICAQ